MHNGLMEKSLGSLQSKPKKKCFEHVSEQGGSEGTWKLVTLLLLCQLHTGGKTSFSIAHS